MVEKAPRALCRTSQLAQNPQAAVDANGFMSMYKGCHTPDGASKSASYYHQVLDCANGSSHTSPPQAQARNGVACSHVTGFLDSAPTKALISARP